MEIKTINVYTLEELKTQNNKAYLKVIKNLDDMIIEDRFDFFRDDCIDLLNNFYNINIADVYYSLSYSQGDGLCFTTENALQGEILNYVRQNLSPDDVLKLNSMDIDNLFYIEKYHNYYNYAHPHAVDIKDAFTEDFEFLNSKVLPLVRDKYMQICQELEENGYACYNVTEEDYYNYADGNLYTIQGDIFYE